MQVRCPQCQKMFSAPDDSAGRTVQCQSCGRDFVAGAQPPPPVPSGAEASTSSGGPSALQVIGIGCLVLVLLCGLGGYFVVRNFKRLATNLARQAAVQGIRSAGLPKDIQDGFIKHIDRLVDGYKSGKISTEQLGTTLEAIAESPIIPMTLILLADTHYVQGSGLSDAEKQAGTRTLQRFCRGVVEETIDSDQVDQVTALISEPKPDGGTRFKEALTDQEVRTFLAKAKEFADAAEVPDEPCPIDPVATFGELVDKALAGLLTPTTQPARTRRSRPPSVPRR